MAANDRDADRRPALPLLAARCGRAHGCQAVWTLTAARTRLRLVPDDGTVRVLMQETREVFARVFGRSWEALDMQLVYDVAHNIAKFEEHRVDGRTKTLCVHRKGATRAFPVGHPEIPEAYRAVGQPVFIPGSMGTASWILVGQPGSMEQTFGTTCHGAGRQMSRTAAVKDAGLAANPRGPARGSNLHRFSSAISLESGAFAPRVRTAASQRCQGKVPPSKAG